MKRRMIVYICTLILVCMFFKTIPTVAKENTDAINIEKMSENISGTQYNCWLWRMWRECNVEIGFYRYFNN